MSVDNRKDVRKTSSVLKNERPVWVSFVFCLVGMAVLVGVDQLAKRMAFESGAFGVLDAGRPWLGRQPFLNERFAFSLPVPTAAMYAIYAAALVMIFRHMGKFYRSFRFPHWVAWVLIVSGALSNVFERTVSGGVRDFIYIFGGIFNFADGYILAGIAMLLFSTADGHDAVN